MVILLIFNENICCDHSLEPSRQDGSYDGHKICLNGEICLIISKLSLLRCYPFLSAALVCGTYDWYCSKTL